MFEKLKGMLKGVPPPVYKKITIGVKGADLFKDVERKLRSKYQGKLLDYSSAEPFRESYTIVFTYERKLFPDPQKFIRKNFGKNIQKGDVTIYEHEGCFYVFGNPWK